MFSFICKGDIGQTVQSLSIIFIFVTGVIGFTYFGKKTEICDCLEHVIDRTRSLLAN